MGRRKRIQKFRGRNPKHLRSCISKNGRCLTCGQLIKRIDNPLVQTTEARKAVRSIINEIKAAHPCKCGESDPVCLGFHHKDPGKKQFNISEAVKLGHDLDAIKAEIDKCEVICHNCHAKHHDQQRQRRKG